jgi:hypothetical protein
VSSAAATPPIHRANYTLELGVWHATCKVCGHGVSDPIRRQAAAIYRRHIRETSLAKASEPLPAGVIDLRADQADQARQLAAGS